MFNNSKMRIARNSAETVPLQKVSTLGNSVKLRYFTQWMTQEKR